MSVTVDARAPVDAHPVGPLLRDHPEATVRLGRVVPTEGFTQYLWVSGPDRAALAEAVMADDRLQDHLAVLDDVGEEVLLRFAPETSPPLFASIDDIDAVLQEAVGSAAGWDLVCRFPARSTVAAWFEAVREAGIDLELRQIRDAEVRAARDPYGLSTSQAETVRAAFEAGYFDVPRGRSLAEFAAGFDVSDQAVSERLRRGITSLLEATIAADAASDELAEVDTTTDVETRANESSESGRPDGTGGT